MAKEIERKFLTRKEKANTYLYNAFSPLNSFEIEQYYIEKTNDTELRIRRKEDLTNSTVKYFKTFKKGHGLIREEIESEISEKDFISMKSKAICGIKKKRIEVNGIEFDFYKNGLVTFEIEFSSVEESKKPIDKELLDIVEKEITGDKEYSNFKMASKEGI